MRFTRDHRRPGLAVLSVDDLDVDKLPAYIDKKWRLNPDMFDVGA